MKQTCNYCKTEFEFEKEDIKVERFTKKKIEHKNFPFLGYDWIDHLIKAKVVYCPACNYRIQLKEIEDYHE